LISWLSTRNDGENTLIRYDGPGYQNYAAIRTVASGVSGPGRFRFGGLRDFILGVQFVDGAGRLLRLGGKVVKNAAGFDVPKFLVGSLGRFGVLVEITFKVFPQPASRLTLTLDVSDPESVVNILTAAANSRWEAYALDWLPDGKSIALRLGGPATALPSLAQEILGRWPGRVLPAEDANALWLELRECRWANAATPLVKIAVSPSAVVALAQSVSALSGARMHLSAGGNVAFVSLAVADQIAPLDENLRSQKLSGITLRGDAPLWLGARTHFQISQAVKAALDAENRFPGLDD
jgi:glycolate oxidase FAD binding subunit